MVEALGGRSSIRLLLGCGGVLAGLGVLLRGEGGECHGGVECRGHGRVEEVPMRVLIS